MDWLNINYYSIAFIKNNEVCYEACLYEKHEAESAIVQYKWKGIPAWIEEI